MKFNKSNEEYSTIIIVIEISIDRRIDENVANETCHFCHCSIDLHFFKYEQGILPLFMKPHSFLGFAGIFEHFERSIRL